MDGGYERKLAMNWGDKGYSNDVGCRKQLFHLGKGKTSVPRCDVFPNDIPSDVRFPVWPDG